MVDGRLLALLICAISAVDAQVKCNDVSIIVSDGWCKGKTVAYKGCFDSTKPDSDATSKASFITLNQGNFKNLVSKDTCLQGATQLCAVVGGKPRDWDCTDVNNECKADNLANNYGVGACSTDAQCTGFAKSTFNICCSSMTGWINDLICQDVVKAKADAFYVPPTVCSTDKDCRKAAATSTRALIVFSTFVAAVVLVIVSLGYSD
jgi:hypothetical protein